MPKFLRKQRRYVNPFSTFSTEFSTGDNVEKSVEKVEIFSTPGETQKIGNIFTGKARNPPRQKIGLLVEKYRRRAVSASRKKLLTSKFLHSLLQTGSPQKTFGSAEKAGSIINVGVRRSPDPIFKKS
jgi:hypothetical protein